MTALVVLQEDPAPDRALLRERLSGNLCQHRVADGTRTWAGGCVAVRTRICCGAWDASSTT